MSVTVYRIEHAENGNGPYNNREFDMADHHDSMDEVKHPTINNDSLLNANYQYKRDNLRFGFFDDWYFAFSSIQQFRSWFYQDDWLVLLDKNGFVLREYEVEEDNFLQGNAQCMFVKHSALCFNEEKLTKYIS